MQQYYDLFSTIVPGSDRFQQSDLAVCVMGKGYGLGSVYHNRFPQH